MLGLFKEIIEVLGNIPLYVLYAAETFINLLFSGAEVLFIATEELLGSLPTPEAPEFIEEINWFFPIGLVLGIAAPILVGYITWLGVKFIFKKMGDV